MKNLIPVLLILSQTPLQAQSKTNNAFLTFGIPTTQKVDPVPSLGNKHNPPEIFPDLFADEYGNVYRKAPCKSADCIYYDGNTWQPCECQCAERIVWPWPLKMIQVHPNPIHRKTEKA